MVSLTGCCTSIPSGDFVSSVFLISLPCLGVWALLGAGSARWLRSPKAMRRFNRCMALLLLISAWSTVGI